MISSKPAPANRSCCCTRCLRIEPSSTRSSLRLGGSGVSSFPTCRDLARRHRPAPPSRAIADRIAGLFDALDLGTTADVLGNGFGGFVASTLAIRHGAQFDRLVLADTGVGFSPEGKQSFYAMAERVRQSGMEAIVDVALKRLFPEDFIAVNPDIMAERRNALVKTNPEFFAEACHALAALDLTADIGKIRNPTLVVVGERDAATPPEMARTLAKALPKADLIEMPGCGHAPMAQAPEAFIKAIAKFLDLK